MVSKTSFHNKSFTCLMFESRLPWYLYLLFRFCAKRCKDALIIVLNLWNPWWMPPTWLLHTKWDSFGIACLPPWGMMTVGGICDSLDTTTQLCILIRIVHVYYIKSNRLYVIMTYCRGEFPVLYQLCFTSVKLVTRSSKAWR